MSIDHTADNFPDSKLKIGMIGGADTVRGSEDLGKFTFAPGGMSFEMVGGPEHQRHVPIVSYQVPEKISGRLTEQLAALQKEGLTYGIGAAANARTAATEKSARFEILDNPGDPVTSGFANRIRASREGGQSYVR